MGQRKKFGMSSMIKCQDTSQPVFKTNSIFQMVSQKKLKKIFDKKLIILRKRIVKNSRSRRLSSKLRYRVSIISYRIREK